MRNLVHLGRSLFVYSEGDQIVIQDISSPQRVIRVDRADAAELAAFLEDTSGSATDQAVEKSHPSPSST